MQKYLSPELIVTDFEAKVLNTDTAVSMVEPDLNAQLKISADAIASALYFFVRFVCFIKQYILFLKFFKKDV